jgi:hypothetical protein
MWSKAMMAPRIETPKAILIRARMLVSKPERWCKGSSARSKHGKIVELGTPYAYSHCARGAILSVSGSSSEGYEAIGLINTEGEGLVNFNDNETTTHADVLDAFDRAIAGAK